MILFGDEAPHIKVVQLYPPNEKRTNTNIKASSQLCNRFRISWYKSSGQYLNDYKKSLEYILIFLYLQVTQELPPPPNFRGGAGWAEKSA